MKSFRRQLMAKIFSSPYPHGIVAAYKAYDTTNDSTDKATLKDITGNGHDILLKSFAYNLGSGYGKYKQNYATEYYGNPAYAIVSKTASQVHVSELLVANSLIHYKINLGTVPSYKVKITGLIEGRTIIYSYTLNGIWSYLEIGLDGIYDLPESVEIEGARFTGFRLMGEVGTWNITIEQIPEYQGGLIFDGINDYGICENMPILTKEKGYTICAIRKWINIGVPVDSRFFTNYTAQSPGAFILETLLKNNNNLTASFGSSLNTVLNLYKASIFVSQTRDTYNGTPIVMGASLIGNRRVILGALAPNMECANIVFYALELYDRNLTPEEIKSVEDRMMAEWYEKAFDPSLIDYQAIWAANGKTNDDVDKNVPNLIDATNPLVPTNFLWGAGSGYGEYTQELKAVLSNYGTMSNASYKSTTFTAANKIAANTSILYWWKTYRYKNKPFKVRITSNIPDFKLKLNFTTLDGAVSKQYELSEKETTIPIFSDEEYLSLKDSTPATVTVQSMDLDDWFTLEQLPISDGLVFDGVDDKFDSVKQLPVLKEYTVVGDFNELPLLNKGVGKWDNWYIYGSRVYINGSTNPVPIPNAIALTSKGLVIKRDFSTAMGETENIYTSNKVASTNYPLMTFSGLAIIPRVLNEVQIRSVYEYLKTLKANNI